MKLWILEFKKMFIRRKFIILIFIFLIVNGFKIVLGNEFNPRAIESRNLYSNEGFSEIEDEISGQFTLENAKKVTDGHNNHISFLQGNSDYSQNNLYYYLIYNRYSYQYDYHLLINNKLEEAKENIIFFNEHNNNYSAKENKLFIKYYENRYINNYYNSDDFEILFKYNFSTFLLLLLCFIFAHQLFYNERQVEMDLLLRTNKKGKTRLPFIKMLLLAIALFIVAVLFYIEDVIIHSIMFHLNGWTNPIYAIENYNFCLYSKSIIEYYVCLCFMRFIVLFCIGLLFSLISYIIPGRITPVLVNLIMISMNIILSEQHSEISLLSLLNPVFLLQPDKIIRNFNVIKLFKTPISALSATIILMILMLVTLFTLNSIIYRNNISIDHKTQKRKVKQ